MTTPKQSRCVRKKKRIEFSCKGFEKMPKKTQQAMIEMMKCAYKMVEKQHQWKQ